MRYSTAQIAFHWISAVLILFMAATGLAYSYDLVGDIGNKVHQLAGQLLIVILAARLFVRLRARGRAPAPHHNAVERILARVVHVGLYLTMIAFVVTGYVSASAETDAWLLLPVDLGFARSDFGELLLETHFVLKWVLAGLFTLHVAGALKHHFVDRDDTLTQMTFKSTKE